MVLMSQLVGLIMDIIAGSYAVVETKPDGPFVGDRSLNETELERLRNSEGLPVNTQHGLQQLFYSLVPYLLQIILSQVAAGGRAARQLKMIHQVVQETFLLSSTSQTSNICLKSQHPLLPT
ncbi:protein STICHEL [Trifolium repens]|nr:protein STICHEL [Trifolium repens]